MTDREQERLRKQLEAMRKQPGNRRCANCASMAVPYVCLDFGTFVCTRCSALHRELTHRVKSLTASKFKPEEVQSVAGNEHDAALYLKAWSESVFKLPSAGNEDTQRAREFIHIKYVEKRWADESIRPQIAAPVQPAQVYQAQPAAPVAAPVASPMAAPMAAPMAVPAAAPAPMPFGAPAQNPYGSFQVQPQIPAPQAAAAPAPAQPTVEDPFAGIFDSAPAAAPAAPAAAQPPQPAPYALAPQPAPFGAAPSFNPAPVQQPVYAQPVATQPGGFGQPTFQPKFDAGAFVTRPQAAAAKTASMNDMFGDMVSQAAGSAAAAPGGRPAAPAAAPAPAPAKKIDNLLDF